MRLARNLRAARSAANPWSEGDGLDLRARAWRRALRRARRVLRPRTCPPAWLRRGGVRAAGTALRAVRGGRLGRRRGSGSRARSRGRRRDLVQAIARWPGGRAWYRCDENALGERVRERTVARMVDRGARGRRGRAARRRRSPRVRVQASVTHTIGGVRVDAAQPRRVGADRTAVRGRRRRRRDRDGRLLERARRGARPRPRRRRGSCSASRRLQVRASAGGRRGSGDGASFGSRRQLPSPRARRRPRPAGGSPSRSQELVAGRLGDEQAVSGLGGHARPSPTGATVGGKHDADDGAAVVARARRSGVR